MKRFYFLFVALLTVSLANSQTVSIVKDSHEGDTNTSPSDMIADSDFFIYSGTGANFWTAAKSIMGTIYYYDYSDDEVWVSDGTAEKTRMLEINPTFTEEVDAEEVTYNLHYSAGFSKTIQFNNKAYFSATNGDGGTHVYYIESVDGDTVRALNKSWARALPDQTNNIVYMTEGAEEPWSVWDGTDLAEPTALPNQYQDVEGVSTIIVENSTSGGCLLGDKIIFSGSYFDDTESYGTELFMYDITAATGPVLLKDIRTEGKSSSPKYFVECNNEVYYRVTDDEDSNRLWKTDGTTDGTVKVAEVIFNGETVAWTVDVNGQPFAFNNKLYFEGDDDNSDTDALDQLYEYDPTTNVLTLVSGLVDAYKLAYESTSEYINFDPSNFVEYNDALYFTAKYSYTVEDATSDYTAYAIYKFDGTNLDVIEATKGYDPAGLLVFKNKIYFSGEDVSYIDNGDETFTSSGAELFVLTLGDETSVFPTRAVKNLEVSPNPSFGYVNVSGVEAYDATYEIYNLTGTKMESGIVSDDKIDYSVGAGMYLLRVVDGSTTYVTKIIVK